MGQRKPAYAERVRPILSQRRIRKSRSSYGKCTSKKVEREKVLQIMKEEKVLLFYLQYTSQNERGRPSHR